MNRAATGKPLPRYRVLAEELMGEITSGHLAIGDKLPGELELVAKFGVSRYTVREALRVLEELGLIGRRQGVGTVVQSRRSTRAYVQTIKSVSELLQYPAETRLGIESTEQLVADRDLVRLLGCTIGSEWVKISGVRRMSETNAPVCWTDVYVLPEYASVVDWIGRDDQPVYALIEQKFQQSVAEVAIDLAARIVPESQAERLEIPAGSASLCIVRRYTGQDGRVFEVSVSEHPSERYYTYSIRLSRGWQPGYPD